MVKTGVLSPSVIVIGAGPVGLTLAIELGTRGVSCAVVEQRDRGRLVPRAKLVNVRTMEHMRRWGIAKDVRAASPLPPDYSTDISFVTSVTGLEITRFTNVFFTRPERDERFAEAAQQIPQYVLEPVLRRAAERLPSVTFLDGWRLLDVAQHHDDTVATVVHGQGEPRSLVSRYLVGCDGAASTVRERLGIAMVGERAFAQNLGIVFRAPELAARLPFPPALHFWTVNPDTPAFMGPADRHGLWWLQATAIDLHVSLDDLDPVAVVHVNHGLVTVGGTVQEAVVRAVMLEQACRQQLLATGFGGAMTWTPHDEALRKRAMWNERVVHDLWEFLVRRL